MNERHVKEAAELVTIQNFYTGQTVTTKVFLDAVLQTLDLIRKQAAKCETVQELVGVLDDLRSSSSAWRP